MKLLSRSISQYCHPIRLALVFSLMLSSCSFTKTPSAYQAETFTLETPFQYYSSRTPEGACEIGKRALLSHGYQLDDKPLVNVRGDKYFQSASEQVTKLTITLVCLPSSLGAVIYANAMETHFELKSHGSSAGVSVSGFGSLSLPWTADKDTLAKVGEVTITAPEFYQRLFELIKTLDG
jgi:hypothetical protein